MRQNGGVLWQEAVAVAALAEGEVLAAAECVAQAGEARLAREEAEEALWAVDR